MTARPGGIVLYPWNIVTVPLYVPLQFGAATRQYAVTVTASGDGPHVASPLGLVVRLILAGLLTVVWKTTLSCFGAHFTVEVRPFPAKKRPWASEAQGLSGEAVKGNPTTTVIPGVDESKPSPRTTEDLT